MTIKIIPSDLLQAQKLVYIPHGFVCTDVVQEAESQEYEACAFHINSRIIQFHVAKITPTKNGQFVTVWKRIGSSPIMPYDITDQVDLFVISVRKGEFLGQFVFPKEVLLQKGYVSKNGKGGKRAMRVYPPWDVIESMQAQKTQAWQILYFLSLEPAVDVDAITRLYNLSL